MVRILFAKTMLKEIKKKKQDIKIEASKKMHEHIGPWKETK